MSVSAAVRGLRAAVFAAVCVLLAAAGHGLALGDMPPPRADAAGFLGVFALGWVLGGRERSLAGIGTAMLLTQAALHTGFDAAHRTAGPTMAPMHPHGTLHATAVHLLAALAASWWLRRGEAALWSLLRRTAALMPALAVRWRGTPLPAPAQHAPRVPTGPAPPRRPPLRHAVTRRGPPPPVPYPR